ncbi:MAG: triose-phosphate isomerase [Halieaceae bacterium]
MRRPLVAGNWKMNGSREVVASLLAGLHDIKSAADVVVCPTALHIDQAIAAVEGSQLQVGAQDCSHMAAGAFTGEVAAPMLAEIGCQWVILGHSERRQYHAESDELVAAKLSAAVSAGLSPIVCVGETREQRENGEAEAVVAGQLAGALEGQAGLAGLVIAYEPVWAIGTGLTATPEQAQDMHAFIREQLAGNADVDGEATRILYGGSVKGGNATTLFGQADIDGALVGGAALDAQEFRQIIDAAG